MHRGTGGRWLLNGSIAAAVMLVSGIAEAQEADQQTILVTAKIDALTTVAATGSRLGLTLLETPASVAVLTGDEIDARGDLTVNDAVSRMPGITNVGNPGNGNTAFAARGFAGSGSVLQLVDGVRLFPVAGTITFPSDPWNIDRIEVLNGPASVLYGQGSLGGAINVITKKPSRDGARFDGEASYGSQDTWHLAAGAGGPIGNLFAYRVDASYRNSNGYVDRGDSKSLALSGAISFYPTETLTITLRDDYGNLKPMKYTGTPLVNSRLDDSIRHENYNVSDAIMHWKDNQLLLTIDWAASDAVSFTNSAYYLTTDRTWRNAESYCWIAADGVCPNEYGGGTPGRVYRTDYLGIRHDQKQYGDVGSATIKTPLGGSLNNSLVVGFDVNQIKLIYSHDFPPDAPFIEDEIDLHDPDVGLYQGVPTIPRRRHRTNEYSLFAEDRLEISDQLSVVGGFRYERDETQRINFVFNPDGSHSEMDAYAARVFHNTTYRVGVVYQPTSAISIYGQYATGVDPISTLSTLGAGEVFFSNPKGDQIEAGVKVSFLDGRGSATLAAYKIVKHDLLAQRNAAAPVEQIGQRSSKGVEASLTLQLAGGFGIDANGTILDANFDDFKSGDDDFTGNTPPGVPETAANLWLTWSGIENKFQARAGLRYVGRRFSDNANDFRVPSYTVIDAGISYAVTPAVAVDFRVYNVFDKDYAITTYNDEQWVLGRPQSFDIAVRARF